MCTAGGQPPILSFEWEVAPLACQGGEEGSGSNGNSGSSVRCSGSSGNDSNDCSSEDSARSGDGEDVGGGSGDG